MMTPSVRNIIVDLIIGNHQTNGCFAVKFANKAELARYLTHVLVNDVTLTKHREFLKRFKFNQPVINKITLNKIVNNALDRLNNEELANLALNGDVLLSMYNTIDTDVPEAWTTAIKHEGLKLLIED